MYDFPEWVPLITGGLNLATALVRLVTVRLQRRRTDHSPERKSGNSNSNDCQ
ncbi:hypothetical protein ACFV1N_33135 [Streptosporangium canum]|uniref:hypothetical protein n=1 Tax=Streptosporangium canum TaxID=324952 RepID=UPI0036B0E188